MPQRSARTELRRLLLPPLLAAQAAAAHAQAQPQIDYLSLAQGAVPVGVGGECVKISPPLSIPEDALRESVAVFEEAVDEVCRGL